MEKNILITGGAGMIGSNLTELLVKKGYSVFIVDNLWRGKRRFIEKITDFDIKKRFYNIDLCSNDCYSSLKKLPKIDSIIHLADIVAGIGYVFGNEAQIFEINNKINSNIVNYAALEKVSKFIYVGTACSFPKNLQLGTNSILYEKDLFPAEPESAYGWSKLIGSLQMKYFLKNSSTKFTTLMLHNVYGNNCDYSPERSQVIPSLIHKSLNDPSDLPLEVWGNGMQSRAFIHVDDICQALLKTLTSKRTLPEFIQIGPKEPTTIKEIAKLIIEFSPSKRSLLFNEDRPIGDFGRACNCNLANEILDWEPNVKLKDGIKSLISWIQLDQLNS